MTDRPVSRYGSPRGSAETRRRIAMGLGVAVVVLGVGFAALAYQRFERVDVKGESAAFTVVNDHTVSITINVSRKDPAVPVVCIVRARAKDGAETGRREILVGPSDRTTVQVTTTVESFRPAAVGDIYGCGTDVPGYLVAG